MWQHLTAQILTLAQPVRLPLRRRNLRSAVQPEMLRLQQLLIDGLEIAAVYGILKCDEARCCI
jgi:hypothetical protein